MLNSIMIIFSSAKLFGNTLEKFQNHNQLIKRNRIIALILICTISVSCGVCGIYFVVIDSSGDRRGFLKSCRIIGNMICFVTDIGGMITSNDRLIVSLTYLRTFDISAKFCDRNYKSTLMVCQIISGIIQINWIIIGIITYLNNSDFPFFFSFNYVFYYSSMSIQIMKFSGLIMLLYRRFDYLHELVQSESNLSSNYCIN